jgi:DNA polymerase
MPRAIRIEPTFMSWRAMTRRLLHEHVPPEEIVWIESTMEQELLPGLLPEEPPGAAPPGGQTEGDHHVPREFLELARHVACHRDSKKWSLLYMVLWRLVQDNPNLLRIEVDNDVARLKQMDRQVRQDAHKMTGFVRFRKIIHPDGERYIAWHRPDNFIVKLVAPFFVERFRLMRWSILTPDDSAHWDGHALRFSSGVPRDQAPHADELEELWQTYYGAVFNPARVNLKETRAEMPVRYWGTLPETKLISRLLAEAPKRVERMVSLQQQAPSAKSFVPERYTLTELRDAASRCTGCDLYRCATQTVFGRGRADARIVLVGEQPGDQEDLFGEPFVGPAGGVLNRALAEVGLNREALYLTNAVKHFKFMPEGKRRKHQAPRYSEVVACRPWLEAELATIRPAIVVCLGATAAKSLLGAQFQLLKQRSAFFQTPWAPKVMATIHPSAVLRGRDDRAQTNLYGMLVQDLTLVAGAQRDMIMPSAPNLIASAGKQPL